MTTPANSRYRLHPPSAQPGKLRTGLLIAALAILLAVAGVALYLATRALNDVGTLKASNRDLQSQVASLKTKERGDYMTVSGGLDTLGRDLLPLASNVCSQDLTGPNGPQQFFFGCTTQKPGT
jgi:hypothetical protein